MYPHKEYVLSDNLYKRTSDPVIKKITEETPSSGFKENESN